MSMNAPVVTRLKIQSGMWHQKCNLMSCTKRKPWTKKCKVFCDLHLSKVTVTESMIEK